MRMKVKRALPVLLAVLTFWGVCPLFTLPAARAAVEPAVVSKGGNFGSSTVYVFYDAYVSPAGSLEDLGRALLFGKAGNTPSSMWDNWLADVTATAPGGGTTVREYRIVVSHPTPAMTVIKLNLSSTLLNIGDYVLTIPGDALLDRYNAPVGDAKKSVAVDAAAPKVSQCALSRDNLTLTVTFSENIYTRDMRDIEEYLTHFGLAEADTAAEAGRAYKSLVISSASTEFWVGVSSIAIDKNRLVITFSLPLSRPYNYLRMDENTLYDLVGNVLAADKSIKDTDGVTRKYTVAGPFDATADYYPPELHPADRAYASTDGKQIVILFNENVFNNYPDLPTLRDRIRLAVYNYPSPISDPLTATETQVKAGNFNGTAPPNTLLHTDSVSISGNRLVITFSGAVTSSQFVAVRIPANALRDKSGNVHDPSLEGLPGMSGYTYREYWYTNIIDTMSDRVPPAYKDCWLEEDLRTIVLNFSEPVQINVPKVTDPEWLKLAALKSMLELRRDGETVYRALDSLDPRWGEEIAEDVRVSGSAVIVVLKEQLSGKANYIRLTHPEALCDFANRDCPWKENNLLTAGFTTKALDATADISPPHLVTDGACWEVSPDAKKVTLVFNEPLVNNLKNVTELKNALAVTYYESDTSRVTRALAAFDPSAAVALSGNNIVITYSQKLSAKLACSESNKFIDITLRAESVRDKAGNVQKLDQTAAGIDCRGDITPPKVQNVIVSPDRLTVKVYFDKTVQSIRNATGLLANLMVLRGFTGPGVPTLADFQAREAFFSTARFSNNLLTLTLRTPLDGDRNYVLIRGQTVSDLAGNVIAGDVVLGPIDAFPDVTPPSLIDPNVGTQYWLSADRKTLKLFFDEDIYALDMDMDGLRSDIGRSASSASGPFADLAAADKVSIGDYILTIAFDKPLTGAKNWFRILPGALRDEYYNVQNDASKLVSVCIDATPDELPPVYQGVTLAQDNRTITLRFNEPVDMAVSDDDTFKSRLQFTDGNTFYPLERYYPGFEYRFSGNYLILTLPETRPLVGKTNRIRILAHTIQDKATPQPNVLRSEITTANIAAYADETPPAFNPLTGTKLSSNLRVLTLTFSEPIVNNLATLTALKSNILIARDGGKFIELGNNDTVAISGTAAEPGNQLIITLAAPLSGSKTKVRLKANTLRDKVGNVLKKEVTTNAVNTADLTPPTFNSTTGVTINDGTKKTVTLTFSEPVISGFSNTNDLKAQIRVSRAGGSYVPLDAKDTVSVSGGKVTVTFSVPLTGNSNYLHIPAGCLADNSYNAMTTAVQTGRIYATPPVYTSPSGYAISADNRIVTLTFDRSVYANAANLKATVKVSRNGGAFAALGAADTVDAINGKLYITFHSGLDEKARVSISAKAIRDAVGNTNSTEIVTGPSDFLEATFDPKTGVKVGEDNRLIILSFSKPVRARGGNLRSHVQVMRNGGAWKALTPSDTVSIIEGKVHIYLSAALMGENNRVMIDGTALVDAVGVPFTKSAVTDPIDAGTYRGAADMSLNSQDVNLGDLSVSRDAAGRKLATMRIQASRLQSALSSRGKGVSLRADTPDQVDGVPIEGVTLTIAGNALKSLQDKEGSITLSRDGVLYVLSARDINLDAVAIQMGKYYTDLSALTFSIYVGNADEKMAAKLADDAAANNYTVVVPPSEFEVTVQSNVRLLALDRYAGRVERRFLLPAGTEKKPNLTGARIGGDGKPVHVPTKLTQSGGRWYACAWSFTNSSYAVLSAERTFPDMKNHWADAYVRPMAGRFMLFGNTKGLFQPNNNMTRAEFAAVLLRAMGLAQDNVGVDRFTDVKKGVWFYDTISIASEYGLMGAYGDGLFKPDQAITREEAFIAVYRAVVLLEGAPSMTSALAQTVLSSFKDRSRLSGAALIPTAVCVQRGIVEGNQGKLNPKEKISRAELCAVVDRFMKKTGLI